MSMSLVDKYIEDTFGEGHFTIEDDKSLALIMTNAKKLSDKNGGQLIVGQVPLDEAILVAYEGEIEKYRPNKRTNGWTRILDKKKEGK